MREAFSGLLEGTCEPAFLGGDPRRAGARRGAMAVRTSGSGLVLRNATPANKIGLTDLIRGWEGVVMVMIRPRTPDGPPGELHRDAPFGPVYEREDTGAGWVVATDWGIKCVFTTERTEDDAVARASAESCLLFVASSQILRNDRWYQTWVNGDLADS